MDLTKDSRAWYQPNETNLQTILKRFVAARVLPMLSFQEHSIVY